MVGQLALSLLSSALMLSTGAPAQAGNDFNSLYKAVKTKSDAVSGDLRIDMKEWLPFAVRVLRENDFSKFSSDELLRLAGLNLFEDLPGPEDDAPRQAFIKLVEERPQRGPIDALLKLRFARQSTKLGQDAEGLAKLYDAIVTPQGLKAILDGRHVETVLALFTYYMPWSNFMASRPQNAVKVASALPKNWPAEWSLFAEGLLENLFTEAAVGKPMRVKLEVAAVDAIDRYLKAHPTGRTADFLKDSRGRITGAAMQGKLLGQVPRSLTIEWSTDPKITKLSDLKGRVVVLDFWATWCGPCIASVPKMAKLRQDFAGQPVTILGVTSLQGYVSGLQDGQIDTKGKPAEEYTLTRKAMDKHGMTWPTVFTKESVYNPEFAVRGIPFVAILDQQGKVRYVNLHPDNDSEKIRRYVEELLKEIRLKR